MRRSDLVQGRKASRCSTGFALGASARLLVRGFCGRRSTVGLFLVGVPIEVLGQRPVDPIRQVVQTARARIGGLAIERFGLAGWLTARLGSW